MSTPLNKMRFQQFVKQAKGVRLAEIHVNREDTPKDVVLKYNGRAPKGRTRLTGKWMILKGNRDEAAIDADVKAFLDEARKTFYVHRGEGLEDESFADTAMEAKGKPIKQASK